MKISSTNPVFTILLLVIGASLTGGVQADPLPAPAPMPAVATPSGYKIAAQDTLAIKVMNFTDLSTDAVVMPDGTVSISPIGVVSVTGLTVSQATSLLTKKFSKYIINPSLSVSLAQQHLQQVVFTGFVTRPGTDPYRPNLRVLEALGDVGGALITGDLRKAVVTHADGSKVTLDLSHPERKAGTDADILLQPDDVVYVPELRDEISVIGEVDRPGSLMYKEDMTVMDAVTISGGVKETADLNAATLTRDGQAQKIDLDAMLRKADMTDNVKLQPGDQLNIPMGNRTYVFGSVGRPGFYLYKPGDRITDALNSVGGPDPNADLGKINVIHIDKVKNVAEFHRISLNKFLLLGDLSGDPYVQPGDYLYIPRQGQKVTTGAIFSTISGLGYVDRTAHIIGD